MKKLINAPDDVVADALTRHRRGPPVARGRRREQGHHPGRRSDAGQGRPGLRRRLRPRAAARRASSASACSTPPAPARCSPRRCRTRCCAATKAVDGGAGVLHIVKNYTGDVLNFQMAAELAADENIEVASVVINDDVAVQDSLYTAGRRGTGATVFVEKIAGALAEQRKELKSVADVAREVNERSRSFGVALTACVSPATGQPGFDLPDDEIELGVGIHGEPGRVRGPIRSARRDRRRRAGRHRRRPAAAGRAGGDGQRHGRHAAASSCTSSSRRSRRSSRPRAPPSPARWSATTSPASTWRARRSPCCASPRT